MSNSIYEYDLMFFFGKLNKSIFKIIIKVQEKVSEKSYAGELVILPSKQII